MLFFIVRMMFSELCFVFDRYDDDSRSVLFLILTIIISALFVVFYCYNDD